MALLCAVGGATVAPVEKPSFVVRVADLERGPKKLTVTLSEAWLTQALADASAVPLSPGEVTVELSKMGNMVLVRGEARVKVTVPCVVTLDPLPFDLAPQITLQLLQQPEAPARPAKGAKATAPDALPTKGKGTARPHDGSRGKKSKDDPELTDEEAAADTFQGEEIVLDDFFREFILLEIPAYPRRSDLPSSEESISSRPLADPTVEAKPLDPRLAPLLGIAQRLKGSANKE
jgi:uncharacterized metal-binding protein YceD (DUF177 family)